MKKSLRLFPEKSKRVRVVSVKKSPAKPREFVSDTISHLSIFRIPRPNFASTLRFPEDITQLESANVSELLGKYTLLLTFAAQDLSELNQAGLRLDVMEKNRKYDLFTEKPQMNSLEKHKREAFFETDRQMRELYKQRAAVNIRKCHTEMFIANFDRYIVALSRELTRRSMSEDRERRYGSR
jgi:hypothetical protein